jgi:hypothetical protein
MRVGGALESRKPSWRWVEDRVERTRDHLCLAHDDSDALVAVVGAPNERVFPVEFLVAEDPGDPVRANVLREVRQELDYYLVELGEADPWAYAHYHCGTASNLYSRTHWSQGKIDGD